MLSYIAPGIMMKFKRIVYAESEAEADEEFEELVGNTEEQYPNLGKYLEALYDIRQRWWVCYRKTLIVRGNNTNNYVESQFLVIKDGVLNRTKEVRIDWHHCKNVEALFHDQYCDVCTLCVICIKEVFVYYSLPLHFRSISMVCFQN